METKECGFSGFKMNGFLALFLHLVVLTAVIIFGFIISVPTLIDQPHLWPSYCNSYYLLH